jgi:phage-related baseplate assembly protein
MNLSDLTDVNFINTKVNEIQAEMINDFENISGRKLYAGDPMRLNLQGLAFIFAQLHALGNFSAKQNLPAYSEGEYLDHVVSLVGVTRLEPSPARTTVRFELSAVQTSAITIMKGTRLKADALYFETTETVEIAPGQTFIEVIAECMTAGAVGNGFIPGSIKELVDPFPYFKSVSNTTESSGGTDRETDSALRYRAFEAPSSFSTAGSDRAYAFWAKSVSPEIGDVAVVSPTEGAVEILPIGANGQLLSNELLEAILNKCTEKHVKPLTDKVTVKHPTIQKYAVDMEYFIDASNTAMASQIQAQVKKAVNDYIVWQGEKLGRDINPSELIYKVMQAGAKRVNVTSPSYEKINSPQVAIISTTNIVYGGIDGE